MARTREEADFMGEVVSAAVGQKANVGDVNDGSGDTGYYIGDKLVARWPAAAPIGQKSLKWEEGVEHLAEVDEARLKESTGWQPFRTVNTVAAREAAEANDAADEVDNVQQESTDDTAEGAVPSDAGSEASAGPEEAEETPDGESAAEGPVDGTPKKK